MRISIHVPLAGDDPGYMICDRPHIISIHVPLAGDDLVTAIMAGRGWYISIHVPLAGDDFRAVPPGLP